MKNKVELKKHLLYVGIVFGSMLFIVGMLQFFQFQQYTRAYNRKLEGVLDVICRDYPNVTEKELISILNSKGEKKNTRILEQYGIDVEKESILLENQQHFWNYLVVNFMLVTGAVGSIVLIFLKYNRKKDQELNEITECIEQINQKNYQIDMDTMSEDELSILKTEVFKTMVMLKEIAEYSQKDKENLKQSLSDISHQLKTPLTSILVMLDNLLDEPEMDQNTRRGFLRDIKREIMNINFLIQSLLKISKLDSDTVVFFREEVSISALIEHAIQNVGILCDLKNVSIKYEKESALVYCDFRWQVEALTNILKNCVEYSPENSEIQVQCKTNAVYTMISIRDFGVGIDEEDQKHIFERFYKGKKATNESVGIGLALAKTIIKSDKGTIAVENAHPGTAFHIKYYK